MMKERYEAEIEQILKDLDTPPPGDGSGADGGEESEIPPDDLPSPFAPGAGASASAASSSVKRWVSPGKLAVVGIGVAVIGMVLARGVFWLPLAGLALIGVAVGWTFLRRLAGPRLPNPPVWRGRAVERPGAAAAGLGSVWERVRRWWRDL